MLQASESSTPPEVRQIGTYAMSFVAVSAALLLDLTLRDILEPHRYAPFLLAVVIMAFVGGLGPALLTTLLAVAATNYFDYRVYHELRIDTEDLLQLIIFTTNAVCISFLTTRRRRAERALERANVELRELDRAKDQFIATVTHELRTPITVIVGWAAMLKQDDGETLRATAAEAIEQSARAQSQLIEDLLDMSRLTLGKLQLEMAPVSLTSTLKESVNMIRPQADRKHISVHVVLPRDPCVVRADVLRLQQICWNLLSNAVKFTPADGHVAVRLSREDHALVFSVSDNGEGIAPELMPRIFEPFRQGNGSSAKGGLGLGLTIVKQLVTMHGGTVEARSEGTGDGAEFIVRLPAVRE